jgi:hypothetical protein
LRLLRLPEEIIEPSPLSLDAAHNALDLGFARDGWLAFTPNEEVWGVLEFPRFGGQGLIRRPGSLLGQ